MRKMQEQFSAKESSQRKGDPMPLTSCAPVFLPGFARRDIPVPLANRGFPTTTLRAVPGKNTGARRGMTGISAIRVT